MKSSKPILLIEDDLIDVMTVRRALKDLKITNELEVVGNGEEAIEYLRKEKGNPCLILLDLNMPRMSGLEFLKAAREKKLLQKIPVVVLTTSHQDQDVESSFRLGVAGYMIKPVDYRQFIEIMRNIDVYWTISELPD